MQCVSVHACMPATSASVQTYLVMDIDAWLMRIQLNPARVDLLFGTHGRSCCDETWPLPMLSTSFPAAGTLAR